VPRETPKQESTGAVELDVVVEVEVVVVVSDRQTPSKHIPKGQGDPGGKASPR
jgi:hypothetical protein